VVTRGRPDAGRGGGKPAGRPPTQKPLQLSRPAGGGATVP